MHGLYKVPMMRAYMVLTCMYTFPLLALAIGVSIYLGGVDDEVRSVAGQAAAAAAADGTVDTARLTGDPSYKPYPLVLIVVMFIVVLIGGSVSRATMGRRTLLATNRLVEEARAVAEGDLSIEPQITLGNEYGEVQRAFAEMIGYFRDVIAKVESSSAELEAAASEMAHTADESGHAIGEVAQAMSAVSEGAGHQVRLISEAADSLSAITRAVHETAGHARSAQDQVADTERLSETGLEMAGRARESMAEVRDTALQTAEAVRSLGEKSGDIDLIVKAIGGIADQTNMLALNASIEAARAGEQGKGFANVAEEVRQLAEEARHSADRIAGLIDEIQSQTAAAIGEMETEIERVESGFDAINSDRDTYQQIGDEVRELHREAANISELSQSVLGELEVIRGQIGELSGVAETSSLATENVSASTQQTSAGAQEVSASAQRVADTALRLKRLAGRFRLSSDAKDAS